MSRVPSLYAPFALIAGLIAATPASALKYIPFTGVEGYQEIQVSGDTFFVAFQGTSSGTAEEIDAAWRTRAAQLCMTHDYPYFIPLGYSFEPVLKDDKPLARVRPDDLSARPVPAAGFIYIPIMTPRAPGSAVISPPTKQGHIRCVKDPSTALKPERLVDAAKVIDDAKTHGWIATK
jgi:hypothetical protein